jgi:hypothetical protein
MLALDDAALARLVIAASAVPHGKRRRWLRELAQDLDGDPERRRRAKSMHRYRQRQAKGERCYRVVVSDRGMEDVISGFVRVGRLSEAESLQLEALERALGTLIEDIGKLWRAAHSKILNPFEIP